MYGHMVGVVFKQKYGRVGSATLINAALFRSNQKNKRVNRMEVDRCPTTCKKKKKTLL